MKKFTEETVICKKLTKRIKICWKEVWYQYSGSNGRIGKLWCVQLHIIYNIFLN